MGSQEEEQGALIAHYSCYSYHGYGHACCDYGFGDGKYIFFGGTDNTGAYMLVATAEIGIPEPGGLNPSISKRHTVLCWYGRACPRPCCWLLGGPNTLPPQIYMGVSITWASFLCVSIQ